ncbi:MAG: arylesterase, partial [Alphaproteobacteria bacterium]
MRLMVYGDSNSWGFLDDGLANRYARRWPVVMADAMRAAGTAVELVEECLPGRATNLDDPFMGPEMNGATPLAAVLKSHTPLDRVLIMLGTNDLKVRFDRSTEEIVGGLMELG